jgi:hypothetical protein
MRIRIHNPGSGDQNFPLLFDPCLHRCSVPSNTAPTATDDIVLQINRQIQEDEVIQIEDKLFHINSFCYVSSLLSKPRLTL